MLPSLVSFLPAMSEHSFKTALFKRARKLHRTILFPDAEDGRTLEAAVRLTGEAIAVPVLVGDEGRLDSDLPEGIRIVDPRTSPHMAGFIDDLFRLRKDKGWTREETAQNLNDPLYFAAMMVRNGHADGLVAGSVRTTSSVLRAGLQVIGAAPEAGIVSSFFLMLFPTQVLSFADCGVVPDPTAEQLASIAVTTAANHHLLTGEEPRVAMLSFSTHGSADHPSVAKVQEATRMALGMKDDLLIDGELQLDAAVDPAVAARKAPESRVAGRANVLIFPDLNAGNIAYKMAERFGGAQALGPIIQGLKKPVSDLSRGCTADDIVTVTAANALMGRSDD